jgi:predicted O-methyltransferase YrrM
VTFTTQVKSIINLGLSRVGLHLDTLTAERREIRRLQTLEQMGYFDEPVFPVPASFYEISPSIVFNALARHASRLEDLTEPSRNPMGYSYDNGFFSSPDAEVLYCMIRLYEPDKIVEVGSGNSTKIIRLAVMDGNIESKLISIDPRPRQNIDEIADEVYREPVEDLANLSLFTELEEGDVLFIDSSHELRVGNDLTHLYLRVFPLLAPGVVVHIHDVFLPYDYRPEFVLTQRLHYSEQYLVQVMLQCSTRFEVLWPGYYLQRTETDFMTNFPHIGSRNAQSLWLRTR